MVVRFVTLSIPRAAEANADASMSAESLGAMAITVQGSIQSMLAMTRSLNDYLRSQHARLHLHLERH